MRHRSKGDTVPGPCNIHPFLRRGFSMTFPRKFVLSLTILSLGFMGAGACGGKGGSGGGGGGGGGGTKPLVLSFEQPARVIPSGDNPNKSQSLTVGDFDKDGDDDIATANETTNDVILFISNGDGTFTKQTGISTSATPSALTKGGVAGGRCRLDAHTC